MQLQIYKTLWGHEGTMLQAINAAINAGLQGIEGPPPMDSAVATELHGLLQASGMDYIAEISTAGSYVPERTASLQEHLDSFAMKLDASMVLQPLFVTCLGACDAWEEGKSVEFFARTMALAESYGIKVCYETHRSRAFFNPWITQRIVSELPDILLTCDFSHWCVVCERLMDSELEVIKALAPHAHHIHARVGYEQGPQVPNPAAPEYEYALRAHQRWWEIIWQAQRQRGMQISTMTPEFGPDGYLQMHPFTQEPVAELSMINQWMADEERKHFDIFIN